MRLVALGLFLLCGSAEADLLDWEERRRVIREMEQVSRGDYTYQVTITGAIRPRCDRAANELRRRRDPNTLRFPIQCGPGARR